jgi:ABC-type polysaccharide/polyol phosphate export permease
MKFLLMPFKFLKDSFQKRFILFQLIRRDIKNKYIGSLLGFIWTIIQPLIMMFIYWFVFTVGFKAGSIGDGIPYIAYFTTGIIAWNFFNEAINSSTNVFQEYSYLVKKINFKISILPIVKILSALVFHLIFIGVVILILVISKIPFSFYWFQTLYYMIAMMVLLLGLSWITSSLNVFVKDISQILTIVLLFLFWLTPIFWDFNIIPPKLQILFKLNPMFYIVDGYRNSFIYHVPFWVNYKFAIYYWVFTGLALLMGAYLFKKLKPHFADVL